MENILDVFSGDAFNIVNLTDALDNLRFVPNRIGQMGLFMSEGVSTTTVAIEQRDNILTLIAPTPRGGPGTTLDKEKRNIRDIRVPHFEINDAVMAEEVQGIRAFGRGNVLETVMGKVARRGQVASQSFEATSELSRIGAIKGLVTYADASTLDLAATFGVSLPAEIDFDLDAGSPTPGVLRQKCASVVRIIGNALDGVAWSGRLHAFCGDTFFDQLLAHQEVRDTYSGWPEARILREGYIEGGSNIWGAFEFGGIVWENYRGSVGGTDYVTATKAHIFPIGVPDLFRAYWAPADYIETVNTMGRRMYSKMYAMPNGKGMNLDLQMNELCICTRPAVLQQVKNT